MTAETQRVEQLEAVAPGVIEQAIFTEARPRVLKGLVDHWPAVKAARHGDASLLGYLRSFSRDKDILAFRGAPEQGGRFFYNQDLSGFNFDRISTSLGKLLLQLEAADKVESAEHIYVGSTSIDEYFPGFRQQNDVDLGERRPAVSIWLGSRSRIAAHFDSPDNIACVVSGRRRFTLFPPEQLANLYVGPLDFTPAGQAISLVDFANPDFVRYPRFREALASARVADLEPGDALYVPSMWWHHVEATGSLNTLVNYWWNAGEGVTGNPLNALIHALLSIRGLPADQREAWRGLFNYYVFGDGESDFSHIPQRSLGVLGKMDAGTLRQLRKMLRDRLAG
jgi:hypothetical protein